MRVELAENDIKPEAWLVLGGCFASCRSEGVALAWSGFSDTCTPHHARDAAYSDNPMQPPAPRTASVSRLASPAGVDARSKSEAVSDRREHWHRALCISSTRPGTTTHRMGVDMYCEQTQRSQTHTAASYTSTRRTSANCLM